MCVCVYVYVCVCVRAREAYTSKKDTGISSHVILFLPSKLMHSSHSMPTTAALNIFGAEIFHGRVTAMYYQHYPHI